MIRLTTPKTGTPVVCPHCGQTVEMLTRNGFLRRHYVEREVKALVGGAVTIHREPCSGARLRRSRVQFPLLGRPA